MNFSKIVVAALSFNCSPWFVQGAAKPKVGLWELHPIGNYVTSPTFGVITTDNSGSDPAINVVLTVEGSFPTKDDHPTIEVFSGVADGEACAKGTKIAEGDKGLSSYFTLVEKPEGYNELMVTSDGSIGKAHFSMNLHDSSVWTEFNGDNPDIGTFDACARITKKHDDKYVSFVDTSIKVTIDAEGKFQTFEKAITVVGTSMKSLEENKTKQIDLDSYLCGPSDSANPDRHYKIGQSFSICVGPTEAEKNNYDYIAVVGFKEVTCAKTIKVVEEGQAKALTTVTNPEGYKRAGEGTVGTGFSSFETVVTPEYHTGLIATNQASVRCSGTVELSFTHPTPPGPKYTKTGCIRGKDYATQFFLSSGGGESDATICNNHCANNKKEYFVLNCPQAGTINSKEGTVFDCRCGNELDMDDSSFSTGAPCPGEDPKAGGYVTHTCLPDKVSGGEYKFGFLGHDMYKNYAPSPAYKVVYSRRRLTASFSTNSGDLLQRHLQESGKELDTSGSFGTEVLLSREDNVDAAFGDLAAPAADTGAVPSTVMATAAGAVVVAAASLV